MTEQLLNMKPNTARRMFADRFNNVEDLKLAIAKIELVSNQTPDVIDVFGEIELEAECLSDGSVIYNAFLTSQGSCCEG